MFCNSTFDHSKTRHFLHRKFEKHEKTRGFALLKRVKPRTGHIETVFFASRSLPAAHGHQIPRAVWLRDARPTRSLAPSGVLQQNYNKHEVLAIGRRRNTVKYSVSTPPETRKKEKARATLWVFAMLSASQTKTQNRETCFLTANTVRGNDFTPSDTNKTANQLAPVDLKGGSPRPQFDKPAEFVENMVKDLFFVKA